MYGFGGVGLSEVQNSISELSVVGGGGWVGGGWTRQTHFMVGPGRGPTKIESKTARFLNRLFGELPSGGQHWAHPSSEALAGSI